MRISYEPFDAKAKWRFKLNSLQCVTSEFYDEWILQPSKQNVQNNSATSNE